MDVYGPGHQVRYSADPKWKTHAINDPKHPEGSKEWLAKKDRAMTSDSTKGLAVILENGSSATRKNISRMLNQGKDVSVYELHGNAGLIRGFENHADRAYEHKPKRQRNIK